MKEVTKKHVSKTRPETTEGDRSSTKTLYASPPCLKIIYFDRSCLLLIVVIYARLFCMVAVVLIIFNCENSTKAQHNNLGLRRLELNTRHLMLDPFHVP